MRYLYALVFCAALQAAPVLTVDNPDISANAGQSGTWTFRLTSDSTNWLSVTTSFLLFETNPSVGIYFDQIGPMGGPVGTLPPSDPDWTGNLATYAVDPNTPVGAFNSATVIVLYDVFSGDPRSCNNCYISSGQFDASISVTVTDTPEPAALMLTAAGGGLLLLVSRRCKAQKKKAAV